MRCIKFLLLFLIITNPALAASGLSQLIELHGHYGVSSDACGKGPLEGGNCNLVVNIPSGGTVAAAYLYSSFVVQDVLPSGVSGVLSHGASTQVVTYTDLPVDASNSLLQAGRMNVTTFLQSVIGTSTGAVTFNITQPAGDDTQTFQTGEGIVVVYALAAHPVNNVQIIDGGADSAGDVATLDFGGAIDKTDLNSLLDMRIGIGFGAAGDPLNVFFGQIDELKINAVTLTNNAGNCDDGYDKSQNWCNGVTTPPPLDDDNFMLITVGGDDDPLNTQDLAAAGTQASINATHERFNIGALVPNSSTTATLTTLNPSFDDNIFLVVTQTTKYSATPPGRHHGFIRHFPP